MLRRAAQKASSATRRCFAFSTGASSGAAAEAAPRRRLLGAAASGLFGVAAVTAAASTLDWPVVSDVSFAASGLLPPLLRLLEPETAHALAIWALACGLAPRERRADPPSLATTVWGRTFPNPLGLAAGFDKDAQAVDGLLALGFGFVEIGSVTPLAQPGNAQPRLFRLPAARAVVNRMGFNSAGARKVEATLLARRRRLMVADAGAEVSPTPPRGLLGVNLGKNKDTVDAADDYVAGVRSLARCGTG